jgi:hypothetical protein
MLNVLYPLTETNQPIKSSIGGTYIIRNLQRLRLTDGIYFTRSNQSLLKV